MFNQAFADSWTRTALDDRTRSMLTIAMLAALGSADELRTHVAGALACGVTPDELVDVFAHISSYAGVARAVPGWAVASSVIRSVSARTNPTDVDPRLT
ncbi:carboxymuconolactone decarboxylase family protein [Rhodococcus wratislaviensis]|uniref:carboxymuconolactone decarboxylase family protein n=1 Tax=Rhodococcus wratislaviensis TaxID=44752 RepID=UPI00365820BD